MRQFIHLGPAFEHEGTIGHEVRINGKPVADLSLTIRESEGKRHAVVDWLGKRGENPMATGPNAFGPKFVRQVLRAVRDTHKITGSITGKRISGFREKRRSEAVNKYGEPLPLPPVVDAPFDKKAAKLSRPEAPRLTLSDPVEATHVEGLGHPEEQAFVHHVRDHTGAPVASMKLVPRGADTLHVAWIGRPPGTLGEDANQLGPSHVREIARIVKRAYPGRTKVTGYRVSGFRAARNNPGSTTAKLSRAGRWLRRAWEATRDTLFDLDEWAESLGRETPTERAAREGAALDRAHRVHAERDAADNKPRASARRERERVDAEVEAQARAERAAKHAAAYKKFADQHHAKFAATFGIDAQRAHKVLTRFAQRAHEEHMRTGATRFEVRGADRTPGSPSEPKLPGGTKTLGLTIRKKSPGPASGTPQGPPRPTKPGGNARPRQFARPSALLKTAPSDLWALLERVHKHHETKLTPDVALNGALADMIDELNGTGHEDPRSTVVRGSGRLDAFGGVYHPALSGAIYHYPHAVQDVVRPFTSGGSEMTLGFTSKGRKASGDEPHIRVPTVQWNVKTPAKVHADKKPRELVFFKPFLTPEGEVDVHGLHEFIDRLPKHARPSWRKAAEENGHPDTREKPVKLMGGFAGGTNTDVPNLVKLAKKRDPLLLKNRSADLHALFNSIREERLRAHDTDAEYNPLPSQAVLADKIDELHGAEHPISIVLRNGVRMYGNDMFPVLGSTKEKTAFHSHYTGTSAEGAYTSAPPKGAGNWALNRGGLYLHIGRRSGSGELMPYVRYIAHSRAPNATSTHANQMMFAMPFRDGDHAHEFVDKLPVKGGVRASWRKALEERGWTRRGELPADEKPTVVKNSGGFAGGTNTDVPNLVKLAKKRDPLKARNHSDSFRWPEEAPEKLARQRFAGEGASVAAAGSANHDARLKVAQQILAESGLTPAQVRAAILHAGGSTRPALTAVISKSAHPDHVKYTAAWLGLATQQPGVAVATVDPAGRDTLHVLHVGSGHEGMAQALKRAGVEKFTFEAGKTGGHRIWVLNPAGKYPVKQLAQVNNARHSSVRVSVTRLGAGSRAAAAGGTAGDAKTRAAYREAIDAFERAGA